jgi:hypothetical protein
MKSNEFFLEKANEYKTSLNEISKNKIAVDLTKLFNHPEYDQQQKTIKELKLKVKLLFSEFDKGQFFIDEISREEDSRSMALREDYKISIYISVLDTFMNHINEFRMETVK